MDGWIASCIVNWIYSPLCAYLWQWHEQSGWLTPGVGSEHYTSTCPHPHPFAHQSASGCRSQTPLDDDYQAAACRPSATWLSNKGSQSHGTLCRCFYLPLQWCPAWVWFEVDLETQGREGGDGGRTKRGRFWENEREKVDVRDVMGKSESINRDGRWGDKGGGIEWLGQVERCTGRLVMFPLLKYDWRFCWLYSN